MIDYKKLLTDYNLWPLDKWKPFSLFHHEPKNETEKKQTIDVIRNEVTDKNGLYIYFKDNNCLYVGKGAPLFNRLKSHYYECYREVPGDTKDKKWHKFFAGNRGELKIYWKQVKSETDRKISELALKEVINPVFNR